MKQKNLGNQLHMQNVKFNIKKIHETISDIERQFNKIDEWFIPRNRVNFYLTHDFHPYFAAFPPELVSRLLKKHSKVGDTFLDPFMGGGSSIVESFILGRNAIGLDISPLSKFITETKTMPIITNDKKISSILSEIKNDIGRHTSENYKIFTYSIPDVTNIDKWFKRESKFDLAITLHHIKSIRDRSLRNFLLLAFSSIIRKVSNAKNAQQHLCIKKNKKIPEVYPSFEQKVTLMVSQMKEYVAKQNKAYFSKPPKLYVYDARKMEKIINPESIDIIITSPPYGTGSRYTDVNRLNFEWLELTKPKRDETMETAKNFQLELKKVFIQMFKVLKRGKYCFLVYGDPSTEGSLTRTAISDAISIGFRYEGLISCPIEKTIGLHHEKYRRFIPKDFILIFRKPK